MGYDVNIERLGLSTIIDLQGNADAICDWVGTGLPPMPEQPNTASEANGLSLYWIGRKRWLLRAAIEREDELLAMTQPHKAPIDISVVSVSDTLQFFSITGPDAGDIISIASPLDHHSSGFPANGVTYTDLFGLKGLIVRQPDGFEIAIERSFADLIADYLTRTTS
jgi:sarcosine oxidase subunit gamma